MMIEIVIDRCETPALDCSGAGVPYLDHPPTWSDPESRRGGAGPSRPDPESRSIRCR